MPEFIDDTNDPVAHLNKLLRLNAINDPDVLNASPEEKAKALAYDILGQKSQKYLDEFVTTDPDMIRVKDMVLKLSVLSDPVLITGPTGTGKEILAHALHGNREGEFLPLNCGGLPESLIESELFGHVKGSFTGADKDHQGAFRAAGRGTVFLDEIGELPSKLQCKLLRAIQENKVRPVGSAKEEPIYCRFVAATKHNIAEMVANGTFRDDLYARLFTFEIATKGLLTRDSDIDLILSILGCSADQIASMRSHPNFLPYVAQFNVRALQAFAKRMKYFGGI